MLSRFFLVFDDSEMQSRYAQEKKELYKKAMPIVACMMLLLGVAAELVYRVFDMGEISMLTSVINWSCLVAFIALSILVRFLWWTSWFVCPILTALVYYYFAYIDFERSVSIIYFRYIVLFK